jgi:hypothetical protein
VASSFAASYCRHHFSGDSAELGSPAILQKIRDELGAGRSVGVHLPASVLVELRKTFRPEFLNGSRWGVWCLLSKNSPQSQCEVHEAHPWRSSGAHPSRFVFEKADRSGLANRRSTLAAFKWKHCRFRDRETGAVIAHRSTLSNGSTTTPG